MGRHSQRSTAVDLLRILGIIGVVAGHGFSDYAWSRPAFFTWQVPLFFMLSGFLYKPVPLGTEIRRRAQSLLLPYFFWLAIVTIVHILTVGPSQIDRTFWLNLLKGGSYIGFPYSAFWFITALFFLRIYVAVIKQRLIPVLAILGLLLSAIVPHWLPQVWWGAGLALPCAWFFGVGVLIHRLPLTRLGSGLLGGLLFLGGCVGFLAGAAPLDMKQGDFGTPTWSMLASGALCAGLIYLFITVFDSCSWPTVVHLSTAGLPVILLHPTILGLFSSNPFQSKPWVILFTLLTCWGVGLLASRWKITRRLLV